MSSCPPREQYLNMLEDRLQGAEFNELAEHLESCPECRDDVDRLSRGIDQPEWRRLTTGTLETDLEPTADFLIRMEGLSTLRLARTGNGAAPPDGYEILEELGRGGMGVVYKARHLKLKRTVALKMLLAGSHAGAEELARFRAEAEVVARLQHPHFVQIHEIGDQDGRPYLALEFVEGCSLSRHLDGHPQPPAAAAEFVETLARAVHHAHLHGVVHRDLKPANILLTSSREPWVGASANGLAPGARLNELVPKITDFGLAKRLDEAGQTQTGQLLGTPSYMAPEQARGHSHRVSPATDTYALGAILYECLTGRPPFRGVTPTETLLQVLRDEPVPPRRLLPHFPIDLNTICLKCLEKDPAKRYVTAQELAEDLSRFRSGHSILARRVGVAGASWRWCRRNQGLAVLAATVLLALAAGFGGVVWGYLNAEGSRRQETRQRERAEAHLYLSRVALAESEWLANNVSHAVHLLDLAHPAAGRPDPRGWEWHYLNRLCHSDRLTFQFPDTSVHALAYSPDGRSLVVACGDPGYFGRTAVTTPGELTLLDADTLRQVGVFRGHTGRVSSAVISPDGTRLASLSADGTVRLWDVATRQELRRFDGQFHWGGSAPAFAPDGSTLAIPDGRAVRLWDLAMERWAGALTGPEKRVGNVVYSPDGTRLAAIGGANVLFVWDVATQRELHRLSGYFGDRQHAVAFAPVGPLLAVTDGDDVTLWNSADGQKAVTLRGHSGQVYAAAWSPDGQSLASAGSDQTVRVWDVATGRDRRIFRGHTDPILCVAWRPDGSQLVSGSQAGVLKAWDATRDQRVMALPEVPDLSDVAFSADGRQVLAAHTPNTGGGVRGWDATTGQQVLDHRLETAVRKEWPLRYVALSPDGRLYAAPDHTDPALVRVYDVASGTEVAALAGHHERVRALAFSPDGRRLASAARQPPPGTGGELFIWELGAAGPSRQTIACPATVQCLVFSPDGRRLAAGDVVERGAGDRLRDGGLSVWDESGGLLRRWAAHTGTVQAIAFAPDGRRLATAGRLDDRSVRLWDAASGQELYVFHGPRSPTCVAFSPDGRRLAAVGYEGIVHLWDPDIGQDVLTLRGLGPQMPEGRASDNQVVFSPDGTRLAANSWSGSIHVWDARAPTAERQDSSLKPNVAPRAQTGTQNRVKQ